MKILGIIPARYASTRLPGKPLALIHGKPMIQRVYEQAEKCKNLSHVIVATDDERIVATVKDFGGNVMLTSAAHATGTERCAEVVKKTNEPYDVVVNIQGDEPFANPEQITLLCACFEKRYIDITTLAKKISSHEELINPAVVKVVFGEGGQALYFSRAAIPFLRDVSLQHWLTMSTYYKHVGMYGYRTDMLRVVVNLPTSKLEHAESLEQLRWLEHGVAVHIAITEQDTFSVDTPDDLQRANKM